MSVLPTVGVQQSIEQIPALIQSSPPFLPAIATVAAMPLVVSEVDKVREVHPVTLSREDAVGSDESEGGSGRKKEAEDETPPDSDHPKEKGHLDLRV
jgi:hypothetical protein